VRYAQKQDKKDFFIYVTIVLPLSGRVGLPGDTPYGAAEAPSRPSGAPRGLKWQDRRIISAQCMKKQYAIY
jgi:hypothetical protein